MKQRQTISAFSRVLAVVALGALLAACGARGPLEPPPGASSASGDEPFILDPAI